MKKLTYLKYNKRLFTISIALSCLIVLLVQGVSTAAIINWPDYTQRVSGPFNDFPESPVGSSPFIDPTTAGIAQINQTLIAVESEKRRDGGGNNIITHDVPEVFIRAYRTGNTSSTGSNQPALFQMLVTDCKLDNSSGNPTARIRYTTDGAAQYPTVGGNGLLQKGPNPPSWTDITAGACNPTQPPANTVNISLPASAAVYDAGINMTYYNFHVYMQNLQSFPVVNGTSVEQGVFFRLTSNTLVANNANTFGVVGGQVVPFTHGTNSNHYVHYGIAFAPNCSIAGSVPGTVIIKDSDNFYIGGAYPGGNFNGTQTVGSTKQAINVGLSQPPLPGYIAATQLTPNLDVTDPQFGTLHGWRNTSPANNIYMPSNSVSNQNNLIRYNFLANNSYMFNILNGGDNNFLALQIPFDEIHGKVPCAPLSPPQEATGDIVIGGPNDFEKGDPADVVYPISINISQAYCEPSNPTATKTYNVNIASLFAGPQAIAFTPSLNSVTSRCNQVRIGAGAWQPAINSFVLGNVTVTAANANLKNIATQFGIRASSALDATPQDKSTTVFSAPYVRFYGNDVSAGGCEEPVSAGSGAPVKANPLYGGIVSARYDAQTGLPTVPASPATTFSPAYAGEKVRGAAAEYAAIAAGTQNLIFTGVFQGHTSAPIRLQAFWGGNATCPGTIYNTVVGGLPGSVDVDVSAGDTHNMDTVVTSPAVSYIKTKGNITLAGATDLEGKQTIFIDGDVYINSNISTKKPSSFSDDSAPYILIVAKGTIYIDDSVTNIDAVLVARDDIYTCSNGFSAPLMNTIHTAASGCNSKLEVNGALIANYVHFLRTKGTRLLAPGNAANPEKSNDVSANAAAETVNYPYYMYFATPYLINTANATFQSYYTLSPYF